MKKIIELSELDSQHWKPTYIFPKHYLVSDTGKVYSIKTKRFLRPNIGKLGYAYYVFCVDGERHTVKAHRLVAMAFIPNPKSKPCIDHINGNKTDNRVDNLKWATFFENNHNPNTTPNFYQGIKKNHKAVAVYKDGCLIGVYDSRKAAAIVAGVAPQTVSQCISERRKDTTQARGFTFKPIDNTICL